MSFSLEDKQGSPSLVATPEQVKEARAIAPDLPDDLANDGLVLISLMPDSTGKMTPEQRDLLREWLFGKLEAIPGAQEVASTFREGKIDSETAIRKMFSLAATIDPEHSLAATAQLTAIAEGKAQFDTTKAMSMLVDSLPPKTRMIARAFISTRRSRIKKSIENAHVDSDPQEEVQHAQSEN